MDYSQVKRVIVVCKTHLDIGFTDYAQTVLDDYTDNFIPGALALAEAVNTPEHKRFVWTVGSYLPWYYLRHATPEARERFRTAVREGHIRWHALPCTTHTELMDGKLFDWGLSIAQRLNEDFGLRNIAAKMTDVPGHTVAIVPRLVKAGIKYLHIGVNTSSRLPNVPAIFRWRLGEDEIIVHYAGGYGADQALATGVALEFFHTNDNMGPPSREALEAFYAKMEAKYPNARIESGTLDEFAQEVLPLWDTFPVIDEEIGDTWIHGVATDPVKTGFFRRVLAAAEGADDEVMENLLLTAEHTWGMDTKLHLRDYTNYEKAAFEKALAADTVPMEAMAATEREAALEALVRRDHPHAFTRCASYSDFVASHAEQRAYVGKALNALPKECRPELLWDFPATEGQTAYVPGTKLEIGPWCFRLGGQGALEELCFGERSFGTLGDFRYHRFGAPTVSDCLERYGRDMEENRYWCEFDFGKPGLPYTSLQEDKLDAPIPEGLRLEGEKLTLFLRGPEEAVTEGGCPRQIALEWTFGADSLKLTLYTRGKDANRAPEALWLRMAPGDGDWRMRKMGTLLDPRHVRSGGNRQMHAVEGLILPGVLEIRNLDAPLVSMGRPNLYAVDDIIEDLSGGFWFCLFNNRWGTNFPQWSSDDMRFEFTLIPQA